MSANYSCIPFYTSLEHQDYKKEFAYGDIYNNCCDKKLLPFQIIRNGNFTNIQSIKIYNWDMTNEVDIYSLVINAGLYVKAYETFSIIIFPAIQTITELSLGKKVIKITDGIQSYYSDVILIMESITDKLALKWSNNDDLKIPNGRICYENDFQNVLYFDTLVGKPEYPFEEEQESLNGLKFPIQQISKKVFKFVVSVPEYVADVARLIRMHDNIIVICKGIEYVCFNFLLTIEDTEQGNLFTVTAEFEENTLVKRNAKAYSLLAADFNGDYNEDFLTDEQNTNEVTLKVNVIGNGRIVVSPLKDKYTKNENVVITATPNGIDTFENWQIFGESFSQNPITVILESDTVVDAIFTNVQTMVLIDETFDNWAGALPYKMYPIGWEISSGRETEYAYFSSDAEGLKFSTKYYAGTLSNFIKRIFNAPVSGDFKFTFDLHSIVANGGLPTQTVIRIQLIKTVGFTTVSETIKISDFPSIKEILISEINVIQVKIDFINSSGKPSSLIVKSIKLEKIA